MTWIIRCLGVCMCAWLTGCASQPEWARLPDSMATLITDKREPRVMRSQSRDAPPVGVRPTTVLADPPPVGLQKPTMLPDASPPVAHPSLGGPGVTQTSLTNRGTVQVSVRAWVNNKPIFDREVMEMARPGLSRIGGMVEPQRSEEMAKIINAELNKLIDSELMYQDAVRKLEKTNPRALDKLKEYVDHEFDKTMKRLRDAKVPDAELREMEPIARRMQERDLISMEYARSRILPIVQSRIGFQEIRSYYEAHKNEYVTTDKIVWQDIYIPISDKLPTLADVQRFAEEALNRCRTREDFDALMQYNEGDSKLRGGEGLGSRRGEIQPAELEEHLFQLTEGVPGPVIPFPRGVHLIRVTKREVARQLPLDEKIQKDIRKELERQLADREYRQLARELRTRAVWWIERAGP